MFVNYKILSLISDINIPISLKSQLYIVQYLIKFTSKDIYVSLWHSKRLIIYKLLLLYLNKVL